MKKKLGRPSKYDPKYCDMIIDHMAKGLSIESFAGVVGVSRESLYAWRAANREFAEAMKVGESKSLLFHEKAGIAGMLGQINGFNATAWIMTMRNRFRWQSRDAVDHTVNLERLSDQELREIILQEAKEIEHKEKDEE